MDVVLIGMKTTLILYISIRDLLGDYSKSSTILKGIFFLWAVGLNSGA